MAHVLTATDSTALHELASQLRVDSILTSTTAGSGHLSSSMSAADLMAVLLARHLRYDWQHPDDQRNDHLMFSKGHASPLLYAMFAAAGAVSEDAPLTGFRRSGSRLQPQPCPARAPLRRHRGADHGSDLGGRREAHRRRLRSLHARSRRPGQAGEA